MPECQYCGAYADEGRTFCPRCRRRMQPRLPALQGAPIEPAMNLAQIDPPLARGGLVTLNGGDSIHYCQSCGASPAKPGRYTIVESFVVFFRWKRVKGSWCRDCALKNFRECQYRCLTRGWWGLLFGPIANAIALISNWILWRGLRTLAPAQRTSGIEVTSRPVRGRPRGYLTTAAFIGLVALIGAASTTPLPSTSPPVSDALVQSLKSATASPTPSGPRHDRTQSLSSFLASPLRGWTLAGSDLGLSLDTLSKQFRNPSRVATYLSVTGYLRGVDRQYVEKSPRRVIDAELWQFAAPPGAEDFLQYFLKGNAPHPGSIYKTESDAPGDAHIFIGARPDEYGFAYGVGVRRVGDIIIHVRYASLSPVKASDVAAALQTAVTAVLSSPSSI